MSDFTNPGVVEAPDFDLEPPEDRIDRIVDELIANETSWDQLRGRVNRLAGIPNETDTTIGNPADLDEAIMKRGRDAIAGRARRVFGNRGVPLTRFEPIQQAETGRDVIEDWMQSRFGIVDPRLADELWELTKRGASEEELLSHLRDSEAHRQRFPGFRELQQRGRAITEREWVALERQMVQILRGAGIRSGFFDDPEELAKFIVGEVSPRELSERVGMARRALFEQPPVVRDELRRFGVGTGDMTAFFLDPERATPMIEQSVLAAETSAAARFAGFGPLTVEEARMLTQQGLDPEQARQGFAQLMEMEELFSPLPGTSESPIGRKSQLGALIGDPEATQEIEKRRQRRLASFQSGGGFARTREGFGGIGTAR